LIDRWPVLVITSLLLQSPEDVMVLPTTPPDQDDTVWDSLKRAIASSSGFQRWHLEHTHKEQFQALSIDQSVQLYLRETLETLAY
jgi:hypothetical protein